MRNFRIVLCALVACTLLSACAGDTADDQPSAPATTTGETPVPTDPTASSTPVDPTDPGTPSAPADPTGRPSAGDPGRPGGSAAPKPGTTTLTGRVGAGVEPGCLLLDGYLLVGGDTSVLRPGARVTVTGKVEEGLMTTCQQGTPFVVSTAHPA
ncbi:hypothetical protein ABT336_15600 [Micromonospora sp. NPDC000207]|uniref:hypothetical protein n=1 Tax=Micromonospora sp. NPDC000207 TaxID=3154246 RepID=UPI0033215CC3